jgi:hypothetical protein
MDDVNKPAPTQQTMGMQIYYRIVGAGFTKKISQ